jgi:hypothetical protein
MLRHLLAARPDTVMQEVRQLGKRAKVPTGGCIASKIG